MMNLKKSIALLLLMLVAFGTEPIKAQSLGPVPVDPNVHIGKLDCGLTYYIRHNDFPEHRVNFYIVQRVGSLQEEESQRGLAHFLEHMAFNGSEHFNGDGKGIIDYTRSLGVSFSDDMSANTYSSSTTYFINNVPSTRQSAIDSCMLILKDWSGGLMLTDEEIDKERGVIREELQRRNASTRMLDRLMETLFPNSKYGKRNPFGLMSVIENFEYQELRDYYHKWYRPDNQALIIVGDVDVNHIEAQIKELFKDCVLDPNAPQVIDEPVPDNDDIIFAIDKDKEQKVGYMEVMFKYNDDSKEEKAELNYLLFDYFKNVVTTMVNERLKEIAQEPTCPFMNPKAEFTDYAFYAKTNDAFKISANIKEGQTETATQALVTEALRIAKHGFTDIEYASARDSYVRQVENRYNNRDKINNNDYCQQYCEHYLNYEPIPSIEQKFQLMKMMQPYLTVNVINQSLQQFNFGINDKNMVVLSFNPENDCPTAESLRAAITAARNSDIEPFVHQEKEVMEPIVMPTKKGKIVKETRNDLLGYTELQLSNGARVILKKTDFNQNEIRMSAFQRGGQSLYDEKDWANLQILSLNSPVSLFGNDLDISEFTDNLNGVFTADNTEGLFQLIYRKFTAINKNEKKFNQVMNQLENELKYKDFALENVMLDTVNSIRHNNSWRYKPLTVEDLEQINYDRILEIAKERTANAAGYTFIFVGAFDDAVIRQHIEQYIASLPAKKGKKFNWKNTTEMPVGEIVKHFTREMEVPQCHEVVAMHCKMPYSIETQVKSYILGHALNKVCAQKIREDASAAYVTHAEGQQEREGDYSFAYVYVYCATNPLYKDLALQIMKDELATACTSVDATAIKEAQEYLIKKHVSSLKDNSYWLDTIREYLMYGIDNAGYEEIVRAQTPEMIAAFARQLYDAGNHIEIVMAPEE